jgi:YD repeat-containing protein
MKRALLTLALLLPAAGFAATPLTCGQPQLGNLSSNGTTFLIGGQIGDSMLVRVFNLPQGAQVNPPVMTDPLGAVIKSRNTGLEGFGFFVYDLQNAGTYQFNFSAPSSTGSFQVAYIPLNRACGANTGLTCGSPMKGALQPGQFQTYQFNGKAGDAVSLRLTSLPGNDPAASVALIGFDSANKLQMVQGNALFSSFQGGRAISYKLTSDGQQTFVIAETQGTRNLNYAINMIDFNGSCNEVSAGCGTAADGSISTSLGVNLYSVPANKGDVFQMKLLVTDSSGGLQPLIQAFDPQGNPITSPGTACSSDSSRMLCTIPADGTYTFLVGDNVGTGTGKYSTSIWRLNKPCNAQALSCGAATSGQITGPLRISSYSVDAQAGDVYMLRLLRGNASGSFVPKVEVYQPVTGLQAQSLRATDIAGITFTASVAGTYNLIAFDDSDGTQSGAYTVSATRLNRPCDGSVALGCGFLAPGSINQPLQTGMYSYPTNAGDAFTVRLVDTAGSLSTALQVYSPNGSQVAAAPGTTKGVDVVNSPGGAYTILVTDQSRTPQQGTFALEAFNTRGGCGANPAQGQSVSGLISGPVPFNSYVLSGSPGDALLVRSASFTPGFAANVDLYDPNGRRLGSGTSSVAPPALTAGGAYTAIVGAAAARATGSYAFSWQLLNNPVAAPLQCGQTVSAPLSAASQFWYYAVNAADGDLLKFLLTRQPATLNAQVELFDQRGTRLVGSTGDIVRKVTAGNYLLLVSPASSSAESGGFGLSLQRPNNPCSAAALSCGQTVLQQAPVPGELDAFTFSGNAGDQISITVTPRQGNYTPVTELYDQASTNNVSIPPSPQGATLNATLSSTSQYTLTVHDRTGNTGSYRVGLQRTNNACAENDTVKPVITLKRPTGGDVIAGGSVFQIAWQSDDNEGVTSHSIRLSMDGGKTFQPITGATALSGVAQSFSWVVPADIAPSRTAEIQVTATDKAGNSQSATSDLLTVIGSGFTPNAQVTYQYDPLNRLTQASYQGGRVITYTYDAAGNLSTVTVQ